MKDDTGSIREDKKAKVKLIRSVMDLYIKSNPNRSDDWYGERFDQLYEKSTVQLKILLSIMNKSVKTT